MSQAESSALIVIYLHNINVIVTYEDSIPGSQKLLAVDRALNQPVLQVMSRYS